MDSINKNQPEDNREDLTGKKAVERIRDGRQEDRELLLLHGGQRAAARARPGR